MGGVCCWLTGELAICSIEAVLGDVGADAVVGGLEKLVVGKDVKVCLLILLEGRENMPGLMVEAAERKVLTRSGGVEIMVSK